MRHFTGTKWVTIDVGPTWVRQASLMKSMWAGCTRLFSLSVKLLVKWTNKIPF